MNRNEFNRFIAGIDPPGPGDLEGLRELADLFPWFHSAHLLLLKGLKENSDIRFDSQLKASALSVGDREVLYHYLFLSPPGSAPVPGSAETEEAPETIAEVPAAAVGENVTRASEPETVEDAEANPEEAAAVDTPVNTERETEEVQDAEAPPERETEEVQVAEAPPEREAVEEDAATNPQEEVEDAETNPEGEATDAETNPEGETAEAVPDLPAQPEGEAGAVPDASAHPEEEAGTGSEVNASMALQPEPEAAEEPAPPPPEEIPAPEEETEEKPAPAEPGEITVPEETGVQEEGRPDEFTGQDSSGMPDDADTGLRTREELIAEIEARLKELESIHREVSEQPEPENDTVPEPVTGTAPEPETFTEQAPEPETGTEPVSEPGSEPGELLELIPDTAAEDELQPEKKLSPSDLIDRFIKISPTIERMSPKDYQPVRDFPEEGSDETGKFITETLAKIYINQGYYTRAINIYEKLALQFPEKSAYFASRIEKIKELIK